MNKFIWYPNAPHANQMIVNIFRRTGSFGIQRIQRSDEVHPSSSTNEKTSLEVNWKFKSQKNNFRMIISFASGYSFGLSLLTWWWAVQTGTVSRGEQHMSILHVGVDRAQRTERVYCDRRRRLFAFFSRGLCVKTRLFWFQKHNFIRRRIVCTVLHHGQTFSKFKKKNAHAFSKTSRIQIQTNIKNAFKKGF